MTSKTNPSAQLEELIRQEEDARAFGFFWETHQMLHDQLNSEAREVMSAIQDKEGSQRIQEEIGDVIHTAIAWCFFAGYDVEETIRKTNEKFARRMQALKETTQARGLTNLKGQPVPFLLELWEEAKKKANTQTK
ncbi:MAG: MazG nucleotide pyrophosphohydrolase domain-containing protein [Bacteroidota bacterium]